MKILHTADIHLKEYEDDRWNALLELLNIGNENDVELFIICGDLFDNITFAERLRPEIRTIFSQNKFKIIILPGNHDKDSFKGGRYFGDDVSVLGEFEKPYEYEDVRLWGFPFEQIKGQKFLNKLHQNKNRFTDDKINILLYHGELIDSFFNRNDFGDEGEERYMPVKLSYFRDLNIKYVLAGHFHSKFDVWEFENNQYFVYPGSPISITKKETGIRNVNIFNLGEAPSEYPLKTPFYDNIVIKCDPFEESNPIDIIKEKLNNIDENSRISLTIKGYLNSDIIGLNEIELKSEIQKIIPNSCYESFYEFKDVNEILNDELFIKFKKRLDEKPFSQDKKEKMCELVIKGMIG